MTEEFDFQETGRCFNWRCQRSKIFLKIFSFNIVERGLQRRKMTQITHYKAFRVGILNLISEFFPKRP